MARPQERWFVASISESQTSTSTAPTRLYRNPLQQWLQMGRPAAGFACRGGIPTNCREGVPPESPESRSQKRSHRCAASLSSDSFRVNSGRSGSARLDLIHSLLGEPPEKFLELMPQAMLATQRQVMGNVTHNLERTIHWVASWRMWHPQHSEGSGGGQHGSGRSHGSALLRASREAQRLSEQACLAEKEVRSASRKPIICGTGTGTGANPGITVMVPVVLPACQASLNCYRS